MIKAEILENGLFLPIEETVSDSVKFEKIKFIFPNSWLGLSKTAVFKNGDTAVSIVLNANTEYCTGTDECYIPYEVIKAPEFTVSVFGVDGSSRATTVRCRIAVLESGYEQGDEPREPTADQYSQITAIANEAKEIASSVREDADNGQFKGDKGDKGDTGEKGDPFVYADFTQEQLLSLKGPKGDKGDIGPQGVQGVRGIKGDTGAKGDKGDIGPKGEQGEKGEKGDKGDTGEQGAIGPQGIQGLRGFSGCFPLVNIEYAPTVTIPVNSECTIGALEGDIDISLSAPEAGYSSEWVFYITQGETAYDIALPEIEWELGIAPTFSANSTTEVRLHYKGDALQGVWL